MRRVGRSDRGAVGPGRNHNPRVVGSSPTAAIHRKTPRGCSPGAFCAQGIANSRYKSEWYSSALPAPSTRGRCLCRRSTATSAAASYATARRSSNGRPAPARRSRCPNRACAPAPRQSFTRTRRSITRRRTSNASSVSSASSRSSASSARSPTLPRAGPILPIPGRAPPSYGVGSGTSELKMSATMSHEPFACLRRTSRNLPWSSMAGVFPAAGMARVHAPRT